MSTEEELTKVIADLGEAIKQAKIDKKPKEEWDPLLKEMLATKVSFVLLCFALFISRLRKRKWPFKYTQRNVTQRPQLAHHTYILLSIM